MNVPALLMDGSTRELWILNAAAIKVKKILQKKFQKQAHVLDSRGRLWALNVDGGFSLAD
jgi:hypothetical protein